jgi:hypothetical protein
MIETLTFQTLPPAPVNSVVWGYSKGWGRRFIAGFPPWPELFSARWSSEVGSRIWTLAIASQPADADADGVNWARA